MIDPMDMLLLVVAAAFAVNMGGSNIAPAFAAPYGAGVIGRRQAALLFGVFVLFGALLAGERVVATLSGGIVPQTAIDPGVALVILLAATGSLLLANLLRVAVSTSSVTVFALIGVGWWHGALNLSRLLWIFGSWVALPVAAYLATYVLGRWLVPLEKTAWHARHRRVIAGVVLAVSCYVAFSIGANNVANAVAPLVAGGVLGTRSGFLAIAPFFLVGALLFSRILKTTGQEITPLGTMGAATNGLVVGTMLLLASLLGLPEPMVMMDAMTIMAIGSVDRGHRYLIGHKVVRKILAMWVASPALALAITCLLLYLRERLRG